MIVIRLFQLVFDQDDFSGADLPANNVCLERPDPLLPWLPVPIPSLEHRKGSPD